MRETSEDRISNLPESALHHIHSFLFIKDSARTSVLSKRWKYIWTTVPILRFKNNASKTSKFMDFVDGTLHRRSSNVDKFSLICTQHLNKSRVHSWICNVIRHNVKELQLDLNQNHPFIIPPSLFTCESLVSLYLGSHFDIILLPKWISFPSLKRLTLCAFNFSDESNSAKLFLNCFVLEELILKNCIYGRSFCVTDTKLKLLKIHGVCCKNPDGVKDCILLLYCPNLITFIYSENYVAKQNFFSTFVALKEAVISIIPIYSGGEMISIDKYAGISQLLKALAPVKSLTVNDLTLQAIRSVSNNLPTFHNVKVLNISDELNAVQGLIALLKASPNLESLIIAESIYDAAVYSDDDEDEGYNDEDEDDNNNTAKCVSNDEGDGTYHNEDDIFALDMETAGCLFPHLKSVCFQHFVGYPRKMRWLELILKNAKVLQLMTIHYDVSHNGLEVMSEESLLEMIPSFPRASSGCVFKFCNFCSSD